MGTVCYGGCWSLGAGWGCCEEHGREFALSVVWASLPAQGGKSEGRQIPGTKQANKSRNVGWAAFPPELLVTCHLLISWLALATQYREILSEPRGWGQCVLMVFTFVWTLSAELWVLSTAHLHWRLCPQVSFFHLSRDLLSVPHCTQLGESEEASEVALNPSRLDSDCKGLLYCHFFATGFCPWPRVIAEVLWHLFIPLPTLCSESLATQSLVLLLIQSVSALVFWIILLQKTRGGRGGKACQDELSIYVYSYI